MTRIRFELQFTEQAYLEFEELKNDLSKRVAAKSVIKSLKFMIVDLRHPSLNTHKYSNFLGPNGENIFESYTPNKTLGAYRVFWYYGPEKEIITILRITPHP